MMVKNLIVCILFNYQILTNQLTLLITSHRLSHPFQLQIALPFKHILLCMPTNSTKVQIYIIKADVCLSVFGHSNVRLTTTPVLMLWGTQGYLWLPYDLMEVINLIRETFEPKKKFFFKKKYPTLQIYPL